ncbi:phage portal protein [Occultella gossypii]|uniref:Phage portal protein n=1 Tax=Occultella gossypii TaxID=2800820 RepID=A0ABS7SAA8_9MICO|nr:phage portal protein [Occultella gossypii]MBZ2197267.1 phage portal protein [Occultella gossypii]
MSLLFGERRAMTSWMDEGTVTASGRRISPDTAKYLAPVFASWRHIYDYISTLPVVAYRMNEDGTRARMNSMPPLLAAPEKGTGPALTGYGIGQWFGQAALSLAAYGNAVGIVRDTDKYATMKPTDVRWLRRSDWGFDENERVWRVHGKVTPSELIVHIPWIPMPGYVLGLSPIDHFATMVAAGLSAQEYADVKRGGGIPPAILKNTKRTLDPKPAEAVRDRAVTAFASGKPFVSGNDWDLSIVSIPPAQAQFIQTLKMTATGIASIYGLDPREVGGEAGESLTYSTDESRALNRANNMRPYIERLEQAVGRLLPNAQSVNLDTDATIRTDINTRTSVMVQEINAGVASRNEWRARTDRPPIPGGDVFNVPRQSDPAATEREGAPS